MLRGLKKRVLHNVVLVSYMWCKPKNPGCFRCDDPTEGMLLMLLLCCCPCCAAATAVPIRQFFGCPCCAVSPAVQLLGFGCCAADVTALLLLLMLRPQLWLCLCCAAAPVVRLLLWLLSLMLRLLSLLYLPPYCVADPLWC